MSGRKYSAIFSMMVCRMESRSSDEVRALATSWKMPSSCTLRFRSAALVLNMHRSSMWAGSVEIICGARKGAAINLSNQNP